MCTINYLNITRNSYYFKDLCRFNEIILMRVKWRNLKCSDQISHVQCFATPSQHTRLPCPSPTAGVYSMELVMPSNHLIFCHPLLLLPSVFPSIRVVSNESAFCISWPKYWSFSFNISPSNEHSGLISFRMDWLDLLAV